MAWWFWIVLWVALVALSLLFFGLLALKLFRSFTALLAELEKAGPRLDAANGDDTGLQAEETSGPTGVAALLQTRRDAKIRYVASKLQRQEQRRLRRMERKHRFGQPQALRDLR